MKYLHELYYLPMLKFTIFLGVNWKFVNFDRTVSCNIGILLLFPLWFKINPYLFWIIILVEHNLLHWLIYESSDILIVKYSEELIHFYWCRFLLFESSIGNLEIYLISGCSLIILHNIENISNRHWFITVVLEYNIVSPPILDVWWVERLLCLSLFCFYHYFAL